MKSGLETIERTGLQSCCHEIFSKKFSLGPHEIQAELTPSLANLTGWEGCVFSAIKTTAEKAAS